MVTPDTSAATGHPPMPPLKKGDCRAMWSWDHFCVYRSGHKGPHRCPCGGSSDRG